MMRYDFAMGRTELRFSAFAACACLKGSPLA
jgi:hypothetical protein